MKKGNWLMYIGIFVVVGLLVGDGCGGKQVPPVPADDVVQVQAPIPPDSAHLAEQSMTLRVQLADTEEERNKGVTGYPGLPHMDTGQDPVHGMLYVYEEAGKRSFYEADTQFPLSTATLADDGTILEIKRTGPGQGEEKKISFERPARYVLQVRQGWFADRSLGAGDSLMLPLLGTDVPEAPDQPDPPDTRVDSDSEIQA
jgi:uncharacterized membrane protein (UPF0127 family)